MKDYCISLEKLRDQNVEEVGSSPLASINARFDPSTLGNPVFQSNPEFTLLAAYEGDNVYSVKGSVKSSYSQPCIKCGADLERTVEAFIDVLLSPVEQDVINILPIQGDHLNIKEIIEDTLILEVDSLETVHEDCPGFKQPESTVEKISLGDVLKKAGLK